MQRSLPSTVDVVFVGQTNTEREEREKSQRRKEKQTRKRGEDDSKETFGEAICSLYWSPRGCSLVHVPIGKGWLA